MWRPFPNKQILDTFARSNGFELALYKISVTVSPTTMIPGVSSVLQDGWVRMSNIPDEVKGGGSSHCYCGANECSDCGR
jgi:hypothetical protein